MNTNTLEGKIAVMQAAASGAPIQYANKSRDGVAGQRARGPWEDVSVLYGPAWDWSNHDYRVKELNENEIAIVQYKHYAGGEVRTCIAFTSLTKAENHAQLLRGMDRFDVTVSVYAKVKQ